MTYTNKTRHGFSIIELAIVLVIGGTIISGIFLLAGQAWEYTRRQKLVEEITTLVNNVHASYAGQLNLSPQAFAALTPSWVANGIIPAYMVRQPTGVSCTNNGGVCVDTPWGPIDGTGVEVAGTFRICSWDYGTVTACGAVAPAATQYFGIVMSGLTNGACQEAVLDVSNKGPKGLVDIIINNCPIVEGTWATPPNGTVCGSGTAGALPVTPTDASNYCVSGGVLNIIRLIYRVHDSAT